MRDFQQACRQLLENPGFSVVAVLTLVLGIGATTTVFSLIRGVMPAGFHLPGDTTGVAAFSK